MFTSMEKFSGVHFDIHSRGKKQTFSGLDSGWLKVYHLPEAVKSYCYMTPIKDLL